MWSKDDAPADEKRKGRRMKTDVEKFISWMQDAFTEWSKNPETGDSAIRYMAECLIKNGAVIPVRCKDCIHGAGNWKHDELDNTNYEDIVCDYFMTDGVTGEDYCKYGTTEEVKWDNDGWQAQILNTFLGGKV